MTETKSKTANRLIRVIVFIVLASLMIYGLSSMLVGSKYVLTWTNTVSENPLYTVPKNSLEVISLGSSWGMTSFSPFEVYDDYGISAYNYSSEQQAPIVSYYVLNEVIRQQKNLKVVLLNPYCLITGWDYRIARKAIDRIPLSKDKLKAVQEVIKLKPNGDPFISYLMPLYKFHTRWKSLNKYDFMSDIPSVADNGYKISNGFLMGHGSQDAGDFMGFDNNSGNESNAFTADGEFYYTKIAELCKRRNIKLILYSQPFQEDCKRYNSYKLFADAIDVPLIDFNTQSIAIAADINWHTDVGAHQATGGAIKLSRYLGKYIHENYDVSDVRGNPKYSYLDVQYNQYVSDLKIVTLLSTYEIDSYLALLNNPRYSVFIAGKGEIFNNLKSSSRELLVNLGLEKQLSGNHCQAYLAVIESGNVVTEQIAEDKPESSKLEFAGTLSTDFNYVIKSVGCQGEKQSSIIINGNEYSLNSNGLNFVVYDNEQRNVIDQIVFDTCTDNAPKR